MYCVCIYMYYICKCEHHKNVTPRNSTCTKVTIILAPEMCPHFLMFAYSICDSCIDVSKFDYAVHLGDGHVDGGVSIQC